MLKFLNVQFGWVGVNYIMFLEGIGMNKELVKQLYYNGFNSREIAEQLKINKSAVNKCIQRNFRYLKSIHLKKRKSLKFYENEIRRITKYESNQYMSDRNFILKNRSIYKTLPNGDVVINKEVAPVVTWDTPRRLVNENKCVI